MKAIFPLVLLALVLGPDPAWGEPTVYHSSDGVDSGQPKELPGSSSETLKLYVCVRSGTDCSTASGDRLRGIDVIVWVEGDGEFTGFDKNGSIVHYPEGTTFASPTSAFRLNAVQAVSPPSAGPQLLGELSLDTGPAGAVVKARGQVVGDDLALQDIPERIIALPEPSGSLLLVSGILGLAALHRLRRRSSPD